MDELERRLEEADEAIIEDPLGSSHTPPEFRSVVRAFSGASGGPDDNETRPDDR